MKVRAGFVSNSSSSSFVIAKPFMTAEQITAFSDWLEDFSRRVDENDEKDDGDDDLYFEYGYGVSESEHYFLGSNVDYRFQEFALEKLKEIGVAEEFIGYGE